MKPLKIPSNILWWILSIVFAFIAFVSGLFVKHFSGIFSQLPILTKEQTYLLILLLLGTIIGTFIYILILWGEKEISIQDKYNFDEFTGVFYHKVTDKPFCHVCLSKNNREVPMVNFGDCLWCPICEKTKKFRKDKGKI
jgi:hypothetical protein